MTDDDKLFDLTRRKVLGSLGALGAGAALGGAGTAAFFSDTETFQDNTLVAGSLDLTVDWEEHYYDGSAGSQYVTDYFTVDQTNPSLADNETGFPYPNNPTAAVQTDSIEAFMDATSIEAFPDATGNDGVQDAAEGYDPCDDGANNPNDLDPTDSLRTNNRDTYDDENGVPKPIISLGDVKPGDFGELTMSFHLCDNDGYVWLQADNVSQSENGLTEPEANDTDEDQQLNNSTGAIEPKPGAQSPIGPELGEYIQTAWWYDQNGNNVLDGTPGKVDIVLAMDYSGSLSSSEYSTLVSAADTFFNNLSGNGIDLGFVHFGNTPSMDQPLTSLGSSDTPSGALPNSAPSSSNQTHMAGGIDYANDMLDNGGRADADQYIVLFTDGGPNYNSGDLTMPVSGDTISYTGGTASGTVETEELNETETRATDAKDDDGTSTVPADQEDKIITVGIGDGANDTFLRDRVATTTDYHYNANFDNLGTVALQISQLIGQQEEVFYTGSLNEALDILSSGNGMPLDGDLASAFDEQNDPADSVARDPFIASTTYNVGFAWWLPVDHGNEVQTDSISFNLGFYTEQARHNDGAGMVMNNSTNQSAD